METISKMKIVAIMVLITLLFQIFSPFTCIMNKSYAAVTVPKPAVVWRRNSDIQTTASGTKYFTVQFAFVGNYIPYSFDFKFKYDKDKIAPANKTNPDNDAALITLMMQQDGMDYGFTTQTGTTTTYLNKTEGSLRMIALGGSLSPTDLGGMHGYDGYMPIYTLTFKFLDKSATTDSITTDLFELMPVTTVLPTGMKVIYLDGGNKNFTDPSYLKFDNFKEAAKKVKSIAIKNNPTKTTYNHGDEINLAGGNLEVTYTDDTKGTVPMTDPAVTIKSGNPANVANPKVQLAYQGYTAEFPITVNDPVNSIKVTTPPTKVEYNQDETVNLAGGVVTVTTKSGAKSTINLPNASVTSNVTHADLTAGEVTLTGTTSEGLKKGIQRITLTHEGKTDKFDIIVNDTVDSIAVSNPKTAYQYEQALDRSQGTINVTTTSGATVNVPLSNGSATVTGYNPTQLGEQTLTVTYLGKNTTYKVNVTDYVDSIEVKAPTKVEYNYGENLNLAGGTVTDVYKSGAKGTPTNLTTSMISGYNPNVTGRQTVTVTKGGKIATFEVVVNDVVEGIRVTGLKTDYKYGQNLDLTGAKVQLTMASGGSAPAVNLTQSMIKTTFNPNKVGEQTLTVEYSGKTTTVTVNVADILSSIAVKETNKPKDTYKYNEAVNKTQGAIEASYVSGDKKDIPVQNANVKFQNEDGTNFTTTGVTFAEDATTILKNMKISYTENGVEKTVLMPVTIINTITGISIQGNPKTQYNVNEPFQDNLHILVSREQGVQEAIPVTEDMVKGFSTATEGTRTATIEYTENGTTKTITYQYTVADSVTSIKLLTQPDKTQYNFGEAINLTGATIEVVKGSGKTTIPVENTMISTYTPNKLGEQQLTVTYGGKTATDKIVVNVNDVVEEINVTGLKTDYEYGQNLDLAGAKVELTMASGNPATPVTLTQDMIKTPFNPNKVGEQTLTVEYSGKQTTVKVNVTDILESIKVKETNKPKDTYNYGEAVNKTQGAIEATYVSTATKDIPVQNANVKFQNEDGTEFTTTGVTFPENATTVTKNMKIVYTENGVEKEALMPVTIVNTMTGIEIQGNPKTQYNVNEPFQDNLSILVTREQGVQEAIDVTEDMVKGFSTTTEGTRTATIEYTENGITKRLEYQYTVTDNVTSIKLLTQPDKTEYNHGEAINLAGATIEVVKGSGKTTIPVTNDMISTYTPTQLGEQQLTVTYGGKTATDKIVVNVNDKVTGIRVTPPTKKDYQKGESLDLNGGTVTKIMASGNPGETLPLTTDMITSTFDSSKPGPQEVIVSLDGHTDKFTVRIEDYITDIVIKDKPKDTYKYGEALGTPGGSLTVTYKSGTTQEVAITPEMIKELDGSNFDTTKITFPEGQTTATKEVKVVYEGKEANYEITIINSIKDIRPQTEPKKDYVVGEDFEENLSILVEREDGDPEAIEVTPDMVEGFDTTTEGKKEVTIKYEENGEEKEYTYEITVTNPITGMELVGTPKTDYIVGQDLELTGLEVLLHKPGGDERVPVTEDMITGYNKDQVGEQTVTVTYNGQVVDTYTVNVENPIKQLEWIQKPQTSYVINEDLSVAGGQFKAIKENGEFETITLTEDMISGFDTSTKGTKTVTVTYEGKKLTYDITIADQVDKIEITKDPKKDYLYNQDLVAGGEITATKASGETETVTITPDMITGYHKDQLGNQTVTIHYGGKDVDFELNVSDYVGGVVITPPSKLQYEHGEELDLSDSKVTVTMASKPNEPQIIPVTKDMITGYDKTKPGSQTVTITYTDKNGKTYTQDFGVNVADAIKTVTLDKTNAKTQYKYGENLDLTNLTLDVTYESGKTQKVPVNNGMISGYNPNRLGAHTVTVTYQGFENTLAVNVVDYVKDITLTPPTKQKYKIGETLSLAEGKIIEKMASGATGISIDLVPSMVSGFDSTTPGTKKITVTYTSDGVTFKKYFEVVVENAINSIEVIAPKKTDYKYGENLDLTGGKVVLVKEDGTKEQINLTKDMVSGYDPKQPGQQVITVTYTDEESNTFTGSFTVNVGEDYVSSYKFTAPSKKNYKLNEDLDLTGGKITEIMASGKTGAIIDITKDMVTGFDSSKPGKQTLTVTYQGKTYKYEITVGDAIRGISVKSYPDKIEYQKGESLDVTGGILNVVKESGIYEVAFTKDMVSGFNPNKSGIQVLKVTYQGFSAQYMVYVVEEKEPTPTVPTTPEKPEEPTKPTTPTTPTKPTTPSKPSRPSKPSKPVEQEPIQPEPEQPNDVQEPNPDDNKDNMNPPLIDGSNNDNQNPPADSGKDFMSGLMAGIAATIVGLGAIAGLFLLILLLAKDRKNVKIYIEEGNEKVLVGKEKVTKHNRTLDLNKYYDRYNEDEYKVVLSKAISKKLDKETVNVIVHDKKQSAVVDYKDEAWTYRT